MTDKLYRDRPGPECLSRFDVSRAVLDELEPERKQLVQNHLQTCDRCRELIENEQELLEQAEHERVPKRLLEPDALGRKASSPWLRLSLAGAAAAVIGLLIVLALPYQPTDDGTGTRIKGVLSLELTIRRQGEIIAESVPAEKAPRLRAGDEIRMKVGGAAGLSVALRSCEKKSCQTFFRGATPAGGWLPTGLTATAGHSTLELVACTTAEDLAKMLSELGQVPFREIKELECRARSWEQEVEP